MASFPDRLRQLRNERKWSQEELGRRINVTKVSVSGYENGNRMPDTDTLQKIADVFGVSIDYLLGRSDVKEPGEKIPDDQYVSPDERKLLETVRGLPPDKQRQVTQFADFLKSQESKEDKHREESAALDSEDVDADITEIAAHLESEYGIDDPGFAEHIRNVIRRTLREYDETVAKRKNNG
ncbi:helix-turn-helix transcriptional regulator [Alicyclobacillus sp.]|uniref:helix-turn-helix transcriptional regulator n=1 Tax=Alicyclobacillus sp. TaxID=61169 RepID=UPI0025B99EAE|nr:helix-turn-helix transcriptional regulator [Alicyclobacillus sp.]MCL6516590.1 helix-turn-helix transcriptional regulator [Alicyclobacillus sp.]